MKETAVGNPEGTSKSVVSGDTTDSIRGQLCGPAPFGSLSTDVVDRIFAYKTRAILEKILPRILAKLLAKYVPKQSLESKFLYICKWKYIDLPVFHR